jgi:calcineurin-like phosphoesterase family protein
MRRWITADWHLGEDRFKIMQRPFASRKEMVEKLISNHNSMVGPHDDVYVLGDVCYQKTPEFLSEVSRFKGNKILVRGNHDRIFKDEDLKPYFSKIIDEGQGIEIEVGTNKCYLTHYPTCGRKDIFNLVGHIHSAWKFQLNMYNVGVDVHHFCPIDIDEQVPFVLEAINSFYDEDVFIAYNEINSAYKNTRGCKPSYYRPF